jgi:phage shock protein A
MNVFRRLFKFGESEVHGALDKMEDPIKMTEQGIRDLKKDLQDSMRALAEVKAGEIRMRRSGDELKSTAIDYERKAMLLLDKIKSGQLEQAQGESLAREALSKKDEAAKQSITSLRDADNQKQMVDKLQGSISQLKSRVRSYENDLITLKARAKTAKASLKINKQMSKIDSGGTISMLEKMKARVEEEEILAQSYEELGDNTQSIDQQIEQALGSAPGGQLPGSTQKALPGDDALSDLKNRMGM